MTTLLSDLRFGVRMLAKNPAITIIALLALTLGIGANTAIFSVVNAVLLRSMPYGDAERLVLVWEKKKSAPTDQNVINIGNYSDWKEQNKVFSDMAAFADTTANFTGAGEPEEIPSQIATGNLFSLLGTNALLGRTFTPEDASNEAPVVVISYGLWQRRFGGSQQIVGQKIQLNNQEHEVIGVLPEQFGWHIQKGSLTNKSAELWQPWRITPEMRTRTGRFASAVARLKPGVSEAQAQAEMDSIGTRLEAERKSNTNWGVNVVPLRTQFTGDIRQPLLILLGAVGFVLLIACANVANLLLARASARRKEIAVRVGLGASRFRIVRQLLTESLLLSIIGGALGIGLAWWGTRALIYLSPPSLVELRNVNVSLPVLGFTFGLALITGLVFGLIPALEASRFNLQGSLKEGGKNIGGSSYSRRFRNLFAVVQVALALVLLVGAGLLVKSLRHLQSVDPGFNSSNLLTMRVSLPSKRYDTDEKKLDFFRRATEQLQTLPGVQSVGSINSLPFTGLHSATSVHVDGTPVRPAGQELKTGVCVTDRNYFQTMQIPIKRGRLFTAQEASEMRHVVVINETFARVNLPGEDPIGKRLLINMKAEKVPTEIIGVVGDNKHMGLDLEVKPMAYWPQPELVYPGMTFVLRSSSDPGSLAPSVRSIIHGLDPLQPVAEVNTMEKLLSTSVARSRFSATLLAVFSVVALVMAIVGIYGVMSYSVVQRTHEIGVRIALGAQRSDVLRLIVLKGVVLGLVGVGVGLVASFGLTRLLSSLLFDVKATDTITYAAVAVGLFLITLVACYVPARRATKGDPLKALRYE